VPLTIIFNSTLLLFFKLQVGHSGLFACNVSNIAGHDLKSYEVIVYEPPSIRESADLSTVIVNQGDQLQLECVATGTPIPNIVWSKNRRTISRFFDRFENQFL